MKKLFMLMFTIGFLYGMLLATPTPVTIKVKQVKQENKKIRPSSFLMNVSGFYDSDTRKLTLSFIQDIGQTMVTLYDKSGTAVYSRIVNTGWIRVQTFLLPGTIRGLYAFHCIGSLRRDRGNCIVKTLKIVCI